MTAVRLDPKLVKDDQIDWKLIEQTDQYRRWAAPDPNGSGGFIMKTEWLHDERLQEENRQSFNDSQGQRFGDGKVVGRIPLHLFYRDVAPRLKEGDKDFLPWYLSQSENRWMRSFRGNLLKNKKVW